MAKRRNVVLGMGALAMGSGAMFTAAALDGSVTPDADFRVIVDQRLIARAGPAFRTDGPGSSYAINSTWDTWREENYTADADNTTDFFQDSSNPLDAITVADLPTASVNDEDNNELRIQAALDVRESARSGNIDFAGLLEVENQSDDPQDVGITFAELGDDASAFTTQSSMSGDEAIADMFEFYMANETGYQAPGSATWTQISPGTADVGGGSAVGADPANTVTVGQGEFRMIRFLADPDSHRSDLVEVATADNDGFTVQGFDDVDLLNAIEIGVVSGA